MKRILIALLISISSAFAQQAAPTPATVVADPNSQVVTIRLAQQPQVVTPQVPSTISELVKGSQDLGSAIGGGLKNLAHEAKDMTFGKDKTLVEGLDDLSKTNAGKFTMAVVAWKVAGRDALDLLNQFKKVFIGIPLLVAWNCVCFWFYRRNYLAYSVLKTSEGPFWNRKKTYETVNEDSNWVRVRPLVQSSPRSCGQSPPSASSSQSFSEVSFHSTKGRSSKGSAFFVDF